MTDTTNLLKKIEQYKSELSFDSDKRTVEGWAKSVKGALVRAEVAKMDPVKDLISRLKDKIVKCNFVLQNDSNLTIEERDKLFIRKEEQMWLVSFFEDSEQIIKDAQKKVDEELENLKE